MTNNDLKQIAQLLDEKLEEKLEQKLEEKLEQKLEEKFEQKLAPIQKELKKHGKALKSLKKDQDIMLKMLDKEQMDQRKRLSRIEKQLVIPSIS